MSKTTALGVRGQFDRCDEPNQKRHGAGLKVTGIVHVANRVSSASNGSDMISDTSTWLGFKTRNATASTPAATNPNLVRTTLNRRAPAVASNVACKSRSEEIVVGNTVIHKNWTK